MGLDWAAIWAGLKALPDLLKLLNKVGDMLKDADLQGDLREIESAHDQYRKATNVEERLAALARVAKLGKRL